MAENIVNIGPGASVGSVQVGDRNKAFVDPRVYDQQKATDGYTFFLVSETPDVGQAELYALKFAYEWLGQQVAKAYDLPAPAIEVGSSARKVPKGCFPLIFMDEGTQGNLAEHWWDPLRMGPAGRIFTDHCSGFNRGAESVCESGAHELAEMMADPPANVWVPSPLRRHKPGRVRVAYENADPLQTHFEIKIRGTKWKMCNFVKKSWFRRDLNGEDPEALASYKASGGMFDFIGELDHAGQVVREGYVIAAHKNAAGGWTRTNEGPTGAEVKHAASKHRDHNLSRTFQRNTCDIDALLASC